MPPARPLLLRPGALLAALVFLAGAASGQPLSAPDRARLLAAGKLDAGVVERLESAGRAQVIVVVRDRKAAARLLARLPADAAFRRYSNLPLLALSLGGADLAALVEDADVVRVGLDVRVHPLLYQAVPLTQIDKVHNRGYTGAGVTVGFVDSGIDTDHPKLAAGIVAEQCFCLGADGPGGCCPNGQETQSGPGSAEANFFHGTRIAGVLRSASAPVGGAPDASLVIVKAYDLPPTPTIPIHGSDIIMGINWIDSDRPDVDVVNLSIGFGLYSGVCDAADAATMAFKLAIDPLVARGTLVVAASGNDGTGTGMQGPACLSNVFSVGGVWDETLSPQAPYPSVCTDSAPVPDQVACFANSDANTDVLAPAGLILMPDIGGGLNTDSGTSYASPLVAACAALLLEAAPATPLEDLKAALRVSPTQVTDPKNGLSFPRLDCRSALNQLQPRVPALPGGGFVWLGLALLLGAKALHRLRRRSAR